jgi:hypothetical protein
VAIRPYRESDRSWAESLLDQFGGPLQARRGELIDVLAPPGFTAERDGRPIGLLTYRRANGEGSARAEYRPANGLLGLRRS